MRNLNLTKFCLDQFVSHWDEDCDVTCFTHFSGAVEPQWVVFAIIVLTPCHIFILLSLPLIATVFCCGCSFFSIVWFCLCFNVLFCVMFKWFSAITFLYCIIIFLSLAGVWFYTSFDDSFYTFVLTLTAPVHFVTIVYV